MKVVILDGGLGTRLAEQTGVRPKPTAEIGDRPILRHSRWQCMDTQRDKRRLERLWNEGDVPWRAGCP